MPGEIGDRAFEPAAEDAENEATFEDEGTKDPLPVDATSDFEIALASLSEDAQERVIEAVEDAHATGKLDELNLQELMETEEQVAQIHDRAEDLRGDENRAVNEGDYAKASELAEKVEDELESVGAHTRPWAKPDEDDFEVVEAGQDVLALDSASWNQDTADDLAAAAADYADEAELDVAEAYLEDAEDHVADAEFDADESQENDGEADDTDPYDSSTG